MSIGYEKACGYLKEMQTFHKKFKILMSLVFKYRSVSFDNSKSTEEIAQYFIRNVPMIKKLHIKNENLHIEYSLFIINNNVVDKSEIISNEVIKEIAPICKQMKTLHIEVLNIAEIISEVTAHLVCNFITMSNVKFHSLKTLKK